MFDAVLSLHGNPMTCGVTKWNVRLAKELGIPHGTFGSYPLHVRRPLLSLKASELIELLAFRLADYPETFDVLWHGPELPDISAKAQRVFFAEDLGCPSPIEGTATRPGKNILMYGMAGRLQVPQLERLKALLDVLPHDYTVSVSSAVHEGHPWDATTQRQADDLRALFGTHLRYLGFLADDALAREIRDAHMIALFYQDGARRNNTTLWAALEAGTPVITNLDAGSPPELVHEQSVFDIHQLTDWPDAAHCREVRFGGWKAASVYSWLNLVAKLKATVAV